MSDRDQKGILVAASALSMLVASSAEAQDQGNRKGVAGYVRGNVQVIPAGTSRAVKVRVGDSVFENQRIVTDSRSRMQLMMVDKSSITIGPNSNLTIDEYKFDKKKPTLGRMVLSSAKGLFRFVGGLLSKRNPVRVRTPLATIGIRGAVAFVEMTVEGTVRVTFFYGDEVTISPDGGGPTETLNQPGFRMEIQNDGAIQTTRLNAAALAALAKKVESGAGGSLEVESTTAGANSSIIEFDLNTPGNDVNALEADTQKSEAIFESIRQQLEELGNQGTGGGGFGIL